MKSFLVISLALINCAFGQFDPRPEDFAQFVADIEDPSTPLPSCESVGVQEVLGCQALCLALSNDSVNLDDTRDINGDFVCKCGTRPGCSDRPTCSQLLITPGNVMAGCEAICLNGVAVTDDFVEFVGEGANQNLTHFVVDCQCNAQRLCSDYLKFSDLALPISCSSLEISNPDECADYCIGESGGLFSSGRFDGSTCECVAGDGEDVKTAEACTDSAPPSGPEACPLDSPCPSSAPDDSAASSQRHGMFCVLVGIALLVVQ